MTVKSTEDAKGSRDVMKEVVSVASGMHLVINFICSYVLLEVFEIVRHGVSKN